MCPAYQPRQAARRVPPSIEKLDGVSVQLCDGARLVVGLHALLYICLTMRRCRRPSASQAAQHPEGSALMQRWHTYARFPCVGIGRADLPSGARSDPPVLASFTSTTRADPAAHPIIDRRARVETRGHAPGSCRAAAPRHRAAAGAPSGVRAHTPAVLSMPSARERRVQARPSSLPVRTAGLAVFRIHRRNRCSLDNPPPCCYSACSSCSP